MQSENRDSKVLNDKLATIKAQREEVDRANEDVQRKMVQQMEESDAIALVQRRLIKMEQNLKQRKEDFRKETKFLEATVAELKQRRQSLESEEKDIQEKIKKIRGMRLRIIKEKRLNQSQSSDEPQSLTGEKRTHPQTGITSGSDVEVKQLMKRVNVDSQSTVSDTTHEKSEKMPEEGKQTASSAPN